MPKYKKLPKAEKAARLNKTILDKEIERIRAKKLHVRPPRKGERLANCPECGKLIALIFPLHYCNKQQKGK